MFLYNLIRHLQVNFLCILHKVFMIMHLDHILISLKVRCFIVQIATATDSGFTPGTELYYLERIYYIVFLIFILLLVYFVSFKIRSMYRKLFGGDKDDV